MAGMGEESQAIAGILPNGSRKYKALTVDTKCSRVARQSSEQAASGRKTAAGAYPRWFLRRLGVPQGLSQLRVNDVGFLQSETRLKIGAKFQRGVLTGLLAGALFALSGLLWAEESGAAAQPSHAAKKATGHTAARTGSAKASSSKVASGKAASAKGHSKAGARSGGAKSRAAKSKGGKKAGKAATTRSITLTRAFVASAQLRPMAQQLAATRSPQAYSGVLVYAHGHPGEGAAAAYLALGHAYMLDRRFPEAATAFATASTSGEALNDYADYLGAQAALQAGRGADAFALLDHFAERHPESIFNTNAPVLLANAYIQQNNPQAAIGVLTPLLRPAGSGACRLSLRSGQGIPGVGRCRTCSADLPQDLPDAAADV